MDEMQLLIDLHKDTALQRPDQLSFPSTYPRVCHSINKYDSNILRKCKQQYVISSILYANRSERC